MLGWQLTKVTQNIFRISRNSGYFWSLTVSLNILKTKCSFFFSFPLQICFCWKLAVRVAKREGERERESVCTGTNLLNLPASCFTANRARLRIWNLSFIQSVTQENNKQKGFLSGVPTSGKTTVGSALFASVTRSARPSVRPSIRRWKLRHKLPWEFHCFWTTER